MSTLSASTDLLGAATVENYTTTAEVTQANAGAGVYDDTRSASSWDDATWILTSSFIIFTMQSGE